MTAILTADGLAVSDRVRHAFFTRLYGNGGFSLQENSPGVQDSRARMAAHLGVVPQNLLTCCQIHSSTVVTVTEIWDALKNPQADALVTAKPGIALGVLTADCVPVLFADRGGARVIGAAHAGWRGAVGGVLENTVAAMEKLGARRDRLSAALGPCIWQDSYEVSGEFCAPFVAESADNEKFFRAAVKKGHFMFDLPAYVGAKLRRLGVGAVAPSPADTCADPARFYSYRYTTLRGEKRAGNLMSAIALTPPNTGEKT